jgi:hypothetical protein
MRTRDVTQLTARARSSEGTAALPGSTLRAGRGVGDGFTPLWLVGLAAGFQLADLVSAVAMIAARGAGAELNPLAKVAYGWGGPSGLFGLKVIVAIATAAAVRDARRENRAGLARAVLAAAAAMGAFGWWSNVPGRTWGM